MSSNLFVLEIAVSLERKKIELSENKLKFCISEVDWLFQN